MRNTVLNQLKRQSTTLFVVVLLSAVGSIAATVSACNSNDLALHDICPDAGARDGGNGGNGGGDPVCP